MMGAIIVSGTFSYHRLIIVPPGWIPTHASFAQGFITLTQLGFGLGSFSMVWILGEFEKFIKYSVGLEKIFLM
jgi:hypothetical protein